jgi:hypothetical protein
VTVSGGLAPGRRQAAPSRVGDGEAGAGRVVSGPGGWRDTSRAGDGEDATGPGGRRGIDLATRDQAGGAGPGDTRAGPAMGTTTAVGRGVGSRGSGDALKNDLGLLLCGAREREGVGADIKSSQTSVKPTNVPN